MTEHKIIFGDSRSLNKIEDKSVQLIITSPPYWQLKDYGTEDQIGFNNSYEEYINNLNLVWKECYRVLSDGCRLCIMNVLFHLCSQVPMPKKDASPDFRLLGGI